MNLDEVRARHETTLVVDWDREFNPDVQPLSNSNAKHCHQDRAFLLSLLDEIEKLPEKWFDRRSLNYNVTKCADELSEILQRES